MNNLLSLSWGQLVGVKMLGNFQCWGDLLILFIVGQASVLLAASAVWKSFFYVFFSLFSVLFLSFLLFFLSVERRLNMATLWLTGPLNHNSISFS